MIGICFFFAFFIGMSFSTIFGNLFKVILGVSTDTILFCYCYAEVLRKSDDEKEQDGFEANYDHLYEINAKIENMENPEEKKN
jgi:hypothetical protein